MKASLAYWRSVLRDAEHELEAAKTLAAISAAGKKLMEAKAKLKRRKATDDNRHLSRCRRSTKEAEPEARPKSTMPTEPH
jgi:hypothetical protein